MAAKWGAPIAAATDHKHAPQIGQAATTQTQARDDHLLKAATQAQAVAPLPNGMADISLVVKMARFMARERGAEWALKPPQAKGAREARQQVKAATNYRVDQVAQKESGRPQIIQKFRELTATQTPPAEFGRAVHAEAIRRGNRKAK